MYRLESTINLTPYLDNTSAFWTLGPAIATVVPSVPYRVKPVMLFLCARHEKGSAGRGSGGGLVGRLTDSRARWFILQLLSNCLVCVCVCACVCLSTVEVKCVCVYSREEEEVWNPEENMKLCSRQVLNYFYYYTHTPIHTHTHTHTSCI